MGLRWMSNVESNREACACLPGGVDIYLSISRRLDELSAVSVLRLLYPFCLTSTGIGAHGGRKLDLQPQDVLLPLLMPFEELRIRPPLDWSHPRSLC